VASGDGVAAAESTDGESAELVLGVGEGEGVGVEAVIQPGAAGLAIAA